MSGEPDAGSTQPGTESGVASSRGRQVQRSSPAMVDDHSMPSVANELTRAGGCKRRLASDITLWFKLALPGLIVPAVLVPMILCLVTRSRWWQAPIHLLLVLPFLYVAWVLFRIKKVTADESGIVVSNYLIAVRIPFTKITGIRQYSRAITNVHFVTVELDGPCRFGSRIHFIPSLTLLGWEEGVHPIVRFLAGCCGDCRFEKFWGGVRCAFTRSRDS